MTAYRRKSPEVQAVQFNGSSSFGAQIQKAIDNRTNLPDGSGIQTRDYITFGLIVRRQKIQNGYFLEEIKVDIYPGEWIVYNPRAQYNFYEIMSDKRFKAIYEKVT